MKERVMDSCEKSMKTFKEDNRISLNEKIEADDDEAEPFLVGDETHKQMLYTQEATTRTHYARLVKYIRLVDYMMMDSRLSLISNSVSKALEMVEEDFSGGRKVIFKGKMQQ
jgi:dynein heavy chain